MTTSAKRTIGAVALLAGLALVAVGLILAASTITRYGVSCGSAFGGVSGDAEVADFTQAIEADQSGTLLAQVGTVQDACTAAVSDRKTTAWALAGPGIGLTLAGFVFVLVTVPAKDAMGFKRVTPEPDSDVTA